MSIKPGRFAFPGLVLVACLLIMAIASVIIYVDTSGSQSDRLNAKLKGNFDRSVDAFEQSNASVPVDLTYGSGNPVAIESWVPGQECLLANLTVLADAVVNASDRYLQAVHPGNDESKRVTDLVNRTRAVLEYRNESVRINKPLIIGWLAALNSTVAADNRANESIATLSAINKTAGTYGKSLANGTSLMNDYNASVNSLNASGVALLPVLDRAGKDAINASISSRRNSFNTLNASYSHYLKLVPVIAVDPSWETVLSISGQEGICMVRFTVVNNGYVRTTNVTLEVSLIDVATGAPVSGVDPKPVTLTLSGPNQGQAVTFTFGRDMLKLTFRAGFEITAVDY
jgi:hypothetical protein